MYIYFVVNFYDDIVTSYHKFNKARLGGLI